MRHDDLLRDLRDAQTLCKNLAGGLKGVADRAALQFILSALARAQRVVATEPKGDNDG